MDQTLVVAGKRKRKGIETFAITHEAKRPSLEYKGGYGMKLGEIEEGTKPTDISFFLNYTVLMILCS